MGIVGDDGLVTLGGDSAGVAGYSIQSRRDPKVFRRGPYVFGFTSSFRMGQLVHHSLKLPDPPKSRLDRFMCTTFVDAVRECFGDGGFRTKHNEVESGGTFVVGVAGRLFTVHGDFQVGECREPYVAVGCGQDIALGSLFSTPHLEPRDRTLLALKAAASFSAGVSAPFRVVVGGGPL